MSDFAGLLNLLFWVLTLAVVARSLLSWFDPMMRFPISQVLVDLTEPIVNPIRKVMPMVGGGIDFSPMIAVILLQVIRSVVIGSLD